MLYTSADEFSYADALQIEVKIEIIYQMYHSLYLGALNLSNYIFKI